MSKPRSRRLPPSQRPTRRPTGRVLVFEPLEARELLATFVVNTTGDAAAPAPGDATLSLREAIELSNGTLAVSALTPAQQSLVSGTLSAPSPNTIVFVVANPNSPGAAPAPAVQLIRVASPLPAITSPVDIDGYAQVNGFGPQYVANGAAKNPVIVTEADEASPMIRIDGALAGPGANGLTVNASNCTIAGLIVTGFGGAGVLIADGASPAQGNQLFGNFLGTLPDPAAGVNFAADPSLRNQAAGLEIASSNNFIGANSPDSINVIANNGVGVLITGPGGTGNLFENNFILANAAQGVLIQSSNNTIGEAVANGGNVVSGNGLQGVEITSLPGQRIAQGNGLLGNWIGSALGNVAGTVRRGESALPNGAQGVLIENSAKNFIGSSATEGRNAIAGNAGDGVAIDGVNSTGNRVLNNYIGFDIVQGVLYLGVRNQNGVTVSAPGNIIGDPSGAAPNTISHNRGHGILLTGVDAAGNPSTSANPAVNVTHGNVVAGNVIGLNPGGASPFPNTFDGVHLDNAPGNTVGGATVGARNVISSNNNGVYVFGPGSAGDVIEGNFLGTGSDGVTDLGNAVNGVILDGAAGDTVGGAAAGAGNVISGNNTGVLITGASATGNAVYGNFIGTDLTGKVYLHNEVDGVLVNAGASGNAIGGLQPGAGNTIAFNARSGVYLDGGAGNAVLSNAIYTNTVAGITEANNADHAPAPPTVSAVTPNGVVTNVQGSFAGAANAAYSVQFFANASVDPVTGLGQGQTPLYTATITTDAVGNGVISLNLPQSVPAGQYVTATLTGPGGDSSIFSLPKQAVPISLQLSAATTTANESDPSAVVYVTRTGSPVGTVTVDYSVGGGTAASGVDYTAVSGTLTFGPGVASQPIVIPLLDPKKVGGSVTVNVALANPTGGASLGGQNVATLTVLDNDPARFRLGAGIAAVNENAGSITLTVSRNSGAGSATVNYATANGTATAGVNYTAASGTLTFNPGVTSLSVVVPVLDDHVVNGPLKFSLTLSGPTGGVLGSPTTAVVSVLNTDSTGGGATSQSLTIVVNTTLDENSQGDGTISLREAIELSNHTLSLSSLSPAERALVTVSPTPAPTGSAPPVPNTIEFALPGSGVQTIGVVGTPLPAIAAPVIINGYSQPGSSIGPAEKTEVDLDGALVQIDGSGLAAPAADGLDVNAPDCEINGLIVTGFSGVGVLIANPASGLAAQGNWLWGDFLGALPDPTFGRNFTADPQGLVAAGLPQLGNLVAGLRITASNNRVGGNTPGLAVVIANNGYDASGNPAGGVGVSIDTASGTGNLIQGSVIFNNAAQGVLVTSSNNTIGEAIRGGGDVIGGNGAQGVEVMGGPNVQGNALLGNFIGTAMGTADGTVKKGTVRYPNQGEGVLIENSPKNTVGGYGDAARNVIGENLLDGVRIDGPSATGNRVLNNFIGFNVVGGAEYFLPNQNGVSVSAPGNFIGDATGGGGNTIDNNRNHGVLLLGRDAAGNPTSSPDSAVNLTHGNLIAGNVIGLNPGGGSIFPNAFDGVHLDNAPGNTIGGLKVGARNVISGNNNGVYLLGPGSSGNVVAGDFIGTAADGVTDLGNAVNGVVLDGAPLNTVGGSVAAGAANVISGNNRGVVITGPGAADNLVQGNSIGTALGGASVVVHNKIDGVLVTGGASNNTVGGSLADAGDPDLGNTIAWNAGSGVNLDSGVGNVVLTNSVGNNTAPGIVQNPFPAPGGDNLQPAPTLTSVVPFGSSTYVEGSLAGSPGVPYYLVQFFASDSVGAGQGQHWLFSAAVRPDAHGAFPISLFVPAAVVSGQYVTATATDPSGDTSVFSNAVIGVPVSFRLDSAAYAASETGGAVAVTVTRLGGQGGSAAVNFAVGGGTAVGGVDYAPTSGTLFFKPGDKATKTFTIPILDARKVGGSVTANVSLGSPSNGATLGSPSSAVLTIQDDDAASFQLQPTPNTFTGAGQAWFTVVRNTASGTASVNYDTSSGTGLSGVNFVRASGGLTFNPGETVKSFAVTLLDDYQFHNGPLTFHVGLGSPVGAVLSPGSSMLATDVPNQAAGLVQFNRPTVATGAGAASAPVGVVRVGGATGFVSVVFATGGGTAKAGVDYAPAWTLLTFGPGETSKVLSVPVMRTTTPGPDLTVGLGLGDLPGHASVGARPSSTLTIGHTAQNVFPQTGDFTPPVVTDLQPIAGSQGVYGVVINFSEAMDVARASDPSNYGSFLTTPGPGGVFGTPQDGYIEITGVAYDAAYHRTVLTLGSPLPLGQFARIILNLNANAALNKGLVDVSGNLLDGTGAGTFPGTPYAVTFGEGQQLSYLDRGGDAVTLGVSGPGLIALRRGMDGEAQQLRFVGAAPQATVLNGQVVRVRPGATGTTSIPSIAGANGASIRLRTPPFVLGGISAAAVDTLAASGRLRVR